MSPRFRGRRLVPQGLASWLALLLVAAVAATASFGLAVWWIQDSRLAGIGADRHMLQRIVARLVPAVLLLERAEPRDRQRLLDAVNGRPLRIRLHSGALPETLPGAPAAPELDRFVRSRLGPLAGRDVGIRAHRGGGSRFHRRPGLRLAIPLVSGGWADVGIRPARKRPGPVFLVWLGATAILIGLSAAWAGWRLTRPLSRLAEATERFDLDGEEEPLPETGPREVRNAAHAFNRMTVRIRRLVEERTLLLAALSHDLKTFLTRLRLRMEMVEDPEQRRKGIADIEEMQSVLDATLGLAREETRGEGPVAVDLAALLRTVAERHRELGREASYRGPERFAFHGRATALGRCFENLVENAVKYGGEAEIRLGREDGRAVVRIGDRGPGIAPEHREAVLAPFFRLESSRSRDTGGVGLGLAVARTVIDRHGGTLSLEDRDGGGLEVVVALPAADAPPDG